MGARQSTALGGQRCRPVQRHTMLGVILMRTPRGPASSAGVILAPVMDLAAVRFTMPSETCRGLWLDTWNTTCRQLGKVGQGVGDGRAACSRAWMEQGVQASASPALQQPLRWTGLAPGLAYTRPTEPSSHVAHACISVRQAAGWGWAQRAADLDHGPVRCAPGSLTLSPARTPQVRIQGPMPAT